MHYTYLVTFISCGTLLLLGWKNISKICQEKKVFYCSLWASSVIVSPFHT